MSDEEDGDDEAFQSPFANYDSMAPRFSVMMGQQLSFDEENEAGLLGLSPSPYKEKKISPIIIEPKHEKRDSGVAGLEDASEVKILEDPPKMNLLSPTDAEKPFQGVSDAKIDPSPSSSVVGSGGDEAEGIKEGEEGEEEGGDMTTEGEEEEDDEEGVITRIDELTDEEENEPVSSPVTPSFKPKSPPTSLLGNSTRSKPLSSPKEIFTYPPPPLTPTSPTPSSPRPLSDCSPLFRQSPDHTHSSTFPRPHSEHAHSPLSSSMTAAGLATRRVARMEDIAQLTMLSRDLDITVSPPTPGKFIYRRL